MVFVRIIAKFDEAYPVTEDIQVELLQGQVYFLPYRGIKPLLD